MTAKELSYIEDAINKERFIASKIKILLEDEMDLQEELSELANFHKKKITKLEKVLKGE